MKMQAQKKQAECQLSSLVTFSLKGTRTGAGCTVENSNWWAPRKVWPHLRMKQTKIDTLFKSRKSVRIDEKFKTWPQGPRKNDALTDTVSNFLIICQKKFSDTVFFSYLLIFVGLLAFPIYKHSISPQIFERRWSLKVVPNFENNAWSGRLKNCLFKSLKETAKIAQFYVNIESK